MNQLFLVLEILRTITYLIKKKNQPPDERNIQHVIKLLTGFWAMSITEFCRNDKSLFSFSLPQLQEKMNLISQDFSIYMSGTHNPLASPALKRGITAAYAQAGTGLQSRLTKSGGRIIMYWVLRITADGIYSSVLQQNIFNHLQWLWKIDSDHYISLRFLYYKTDTVCNDPETNFLLLQDLSPCILPLYFLLARNLHQLF